MASSGTVSLSIQHTLPEVIAFNRLAPTQRFRGWFVIGMGLVLIAWGWLVAYLPFPRGPNAPAPFEGAVMASLSGGLVVLLGLLTPSLAGLGSWLRPSRRRPFRVDISAEHVLVDSSAGTVIVPWDVWTGRRETARMLVLLGPGDCLVIPKRLCRFDQLESLRVLFEQKVKA